MGLDTVDLIYNIEKQFAINIPDSEAEKASTVQEIFEMVLQHLPDDIDANAVYKKVVNIIADQAWLDPTEIEPHHSITNDLGLD